MNFSKKFNLSEAEKGSLVGFLMGLLFLGTSYLFDIFQKRFCIDLGNLSIKLGGAPLEEICIPYVALFPFILALVGLITGKIIDIIIDKKNKKSIRNRKKNGRKVKSEKNKREEEKIRLEQAVKWSRIAKQRGFTNKQIRESFRKKGWKKEDIDRIIQTI